MNDKTQNINDQPPASHWHEYLNSEKDFKQLKKKKNTKANFHHGQLPQTEQLTENIPKYFSHHGRNNNELEFFNELFLIMRFSLMGRKKSQGQR